MSLSRKHEFYVYALLDGRKPGKYVYGDYIFSYEPFYIGKGRGNRVSHHAYLSVCNTGPNRHKTNKIRKIQSEGYEVVECLVEENKTEKQAFILEIRMIKTIGRSDLKLGTLTNLTDGGEGNTGYVASEKTKDKIRMAKIGTVMPYGFVEKRAVSMSKRTEEEKRKTTKKKSLSMTKHYEAIEPKRLREIADKISASKLGHAVSEETKAKISAALKGRKLTEEHRANMRGRISSKETRDKMSIAQYGHSVSKETRAKISAGRIGIQYSEETRKRMSDSAKKRIR